jgi:hypothetical protein
MRAGDGPRSGVLEDDPGADVTGTGSENPHTTTTKTRENP